MMKTDVTKHDFCRRLSRRRSRWSLVSSRWSRHISRGCGDKGGVRGKRPHCESAWLPENQKPETRNQKLFTTR
jgi:hypothetical protein